jgi:hypothetical protein
VEATVKMAFRSFLEEAICVQQDVLSFFQSLRTGQVYSERRRATLSCRNQPFFFFYLKLIKKIFCPIPRLIASGLLLIELLQYGFCDLFLTCGSKVTD